MPMATGDIAGRVATLRERVDRIAVAAGRSASDVAIVGVSKFQPREAIVEAIGAGLHDIGENYVQEAEAKLPGLPPVTRHFLGHVQTNKAKRIAALFDVVHGVDRLDAGLALAKAARSLDRTLRVLVQVNVSPQERFGVAPADAPALAERLRGEAGIDVDGVMAIGPLDGDVDAAFAEAERTFRTVGGRTLSLGMSGDWETAIRHGSTMLRIGTAIFGARPVRDAAKGEPKA